MASRSPLLAWLAERRAAECLDGEAWSLLFAEARACALLGRVAAELGRQVPPLSMPARFRDHVDAASRHAEGLRRDVVRELDCLAEALAPLATPVLLLKGGAYVAAGLPAAEGRTFSDVDILVAASWLAEAEGALMLAGWRSSHHDRYDQRYYREWSHEIPPMTHIRRGTTVDLHHSLVMPTCRIRVDSAAMVAAAVPIPGTPWHRLGDEDLILHAASHLLLNAEFDRGLRDLWDIDLLLRHFGREQPDFASRVLDRARHVGLEDIARQTFALCWRMFRTPLAEDCLDRRPGLASRLVALAATTRHPDTRPGLQGLADFLLMLRELALRLPAPLLARHLAHKAAAGLRRPQQKAA